MNDRPRRRVIVGLDGSVPSLRALRLALSEARHRDAELHVVHVRPPARPDLATASGYVNPYAIGVSAEGPRDVHLDWQAQGCLTRWVDEALGGPPTNVTVYRRVRVGSPGPILVKLGWRDDDLIVVGTRKGGRLRRLLGLSVSRYCIAHADCPVLVVPPDSFARSVRHREHLDRLVPGRDPWKEFDSVIAVERQRTG